ncbi:hypothetical protein [Microbulbifer sp. ZKSA002]|uniref:hypothetical protein n=1 Tax=Microbulbifer sp. ZKSA002 TaxID=3243388 RepID=UPI0040395D47
MECSSEIDALHKVLREAEALENHDKKAIEDTIKTYLRVTHIAMGYKGVWIWHHCNFDSEEVEDIYGGSIVQTDKNGAVREGSS